MLVCAVSMWILVFFLCICFIHQSELFGWIGYLCLGDKAGLRYSHVGAWTHSAYLPHPPTPPTPLPPFRLLTSVLILICTGTPPWFLVSLSKPVRHMFQFCWIQHPAIKSHFRLRVWGFEIGCSCEARQEKCYGQMRDATSVWLIVKSSWWHQPCEQLDHFFSQLHPADSACLLSHLSAHRRSTLVSFCYYWALLRVCRPPPPQTSRGGKSPTTLVFTVVFGDLTSRWLHFNSGFFFFFWNG